MVIGWFIFINLMQYSLILNTQNWKRSFKSPIDHEAAQWFNVLNNFDFSEDNRINIWVNDIPILGLKGISLAGRTTSNDYCF